MFGLWRTLLALAVVAYHLLRIPVIGEYAVFSFFVLSGFLMTTIMHESYGYGLGGLRRYAMNRFLRLYPSYWIAAAIGLLVIYFAGEGFTRQYHEAFYTPIHVKEIIYNVLMIFPHFIPTWVTPRLSPPTWALTVEITYYVAIGLGASKTRRRALVWVLLSGLYALTAVALRLGDGYDYLSIPAGSLPFSVGACTYFYKDEIYRRIKRARLGLAVIAAVYTAIFMGFAAASWLGHPGTAVFGLYINIFASAALLVMLYFDGIPALSKASDKLIGDYSYPVYLVHWQLGALACYWLFRKPVLGLSIHGVEALALNLVLVAGVASFMIFAIDPMIERIRARIRGMRRPLPPRSRSQASIDDGALGIPGAGTPANEVRRDPRAPPI